MARIARIVALLLVACRATPHGAAGAGSPSVKPAVAAALPTGDGDREPDVAVVLTTSEDRCTWLLFDASTKQARRFLETPGACPERVVFDPFAAVTYVESDGTILRAAWGERSATIVAPLPELATAPRLFISATTGRLRIQVFHELADDAVVEQGGQRFDRFENRLYPRSESRSGIPSMLLIWELVPDGRGARWQRIVTEPTVYNPFYAQSDDAPDRKARDGTVTLRELLLQRDEGGALRELGTQLDPALVALFPPVSTLDPDEPGAAVFHLDATHHLIAGLATGDAVQITEPLLYCRGDCAQWDTLTNTSTPPGPLDQRAYASHLPLYIGVRRGVALVEEMVRGDRVSFYASTGATPILTLDSSIGAWGPFRGLWTRTAAARR